ncbi:hypothetical protein D7Z96_02525 [Pseudarthrobacter phenanthrenivorans]|uniref:Uncharacterized protein n=2 Tax=Pseudarthrobacter phenanthrenivorans TaxID=361575 RepID=A0A3B0G3R4_PSEPS|nr:hypothetical protein D7Z96_02525 [Pseudarthrobacter phenanthrenivorans]
MAAEGAPSATVPTLEPGANGGTSDASGQNGGQAGAASEEPGQAGSQGQQAGSATVAPLAPLDATQTSAAAPASGRTPQAAGVPRSAGQNVGSFLTAQPEVQSAMVGVGVGLVGLAAAAGAVYLRMRRP